MKKDIIIPCIIATVMAVTFTLLSQGLSLIATFVPAVPIALWLYFKKCYNKNMIVSKVLPLYLLGIGFQLVHFSEEYLFGFNEKFGPLFGGHSYNHNLFVCFNMFAYLLFILGAIGFYKNIKLLMFIAIFFIVYGMIGNGLWHIVYCMMVKGYFPGIYTGFLNLLIAPMLLKWLWKSQPSYTPVLKNISSKNHLS
jgi:Protein of unknown function with HXXEE motif